MDESEEKGLRLLSLDGGGIRGLSTLHVLQCILLSVQHKLNLPKVPLPCEIFDLIGGTSTGGLIALMLGRLRMSVDDAIAAYVELSKDIFSKKQSFRDGKYSAKGLEAAVKKIVDQHAGDTGPGIMDPVSADKLCRTFVCAVTAKNMNARSTSLFRSYRAPGQRPIDCTIIEAARATTAAPTFFERAVINVQGIEREYIDGGVTQNNPCDIVFEEAELVFPGRSIACIISIGTGKLPTIRLEKQGVIGDMIPLRVAEAMAAITTETERTHQTIQRRFRARRNIYFRFNVEEGMQDIALDEWNKLDDVMSHAEKYMESEDVRPKLEESVKGLAEGHPTLNFSDAIVKVPAERHLARKAERKHCPPPSRVFTGRADVLAVMNKHFSKSTNEQLMFVLYGLGGSGKSEIMRRFVADSQAQVEGHPQRFSEVLYVDASSLATLEVGLSSIALDKRLGDDWKEIVKWLVRTRERWLLVLDNADDAELELRPFIPQCSHGNIVITTRNQQLRLYPGSCEISRMSEQDAKALFVRRSQLRNSEDDKINKLIIELIGELDFLALGIVQAAAYLQVNTTCTIEQYLTMLRSDRRNVLEKSQNFVNRPDDYEKTVYTTWNISLERLGETHPEAVKFLYICSFLHHKNISETMFVNAAISAPQYKHSAITLSHSDISWIQVFLSPFVNPTPETSDAFHQIAAHLCAYSLVEVTLEQNLSFHRLVHDWSRRRALTAKLDPNCSALILCLSFAPFTDLKAPDAIAYTRMLLPHMQELQASLDKSFNADIAFDFEEVYYHHGWWWHAEGAGILAIETMKRVLSEEHPDTLAIMANLASTYRNQGRWTEAEGLEVKVLETRKLVLGEEHPDTLTSVANLALTYCDQGRWTEAEGLQVTVLETRKQVLGEAHPHTLNIMANLASTYSNQGRWTEAEGLEVTVLETRKQVLGEEHHDTLTSMANLASTYWNQGRWTEAEGLEVKVLEARKRVLGDEHPDTLTSVANLASTYWNQGRWMEAEGLQVTVLEAMKRVLGEEHPETLISMAWLASTYRNKGRWTEAEGMAVTVFEASKRVLGEEHPHTLASTENLASTYMNQGRWTEAEGLEVTVLEARKRVYGEAHPDTLNSMANLASIYRNQGRSVEAKRLEEFVVERTAR